MFDVSARGDAHSSGEYTSGGFLMRVYKIQVEPMIIRIVECVQ